jgi:two-component system, chemotaxis family, sensor kinase CheA
MATGDENFVAGFMDDYYAECDEHLSTIRRLLLTLEESIGRHPEQPVLEELFRSFHSIKGISGMVELREAEMLAHHMESLLRALRQHGVVVEAAAADALVRGVNVLERTIAARRTGQPAPASAEAIALIETAIQDATPSHGHAAAVPSGGEHPSWRLTFVPSPALVERGVNVDSVRARLRAVGTIVDAVPKVLATGIAFEFLFAGDLDAATLETFRADGIAVDPLDQDQVSSSDGSTIGARTLDGSGSRGSEVVAVAPGHIVRVELSRLDELMRMIGDLVISRARLDDALAAAERHVPAREWRAIQENAVLIERQLKDLRDGVTRVRLVPVREIFQRMRFVVRDLEREIETKVRLDLRGQQTEIDKYLIERMMDPVLHLVRNAVTHGFESPAERLAAGKPAEGTLTLSAVGVGDSVLLEIADDGRGVDLKAVTARARTLGLALPDGELDEATILDLICAPGFSTRDEIDRASGRGVGMSVVRTTVRELNGRISMSTTPGKGTRFAIELPLTLSIADALIATVGDRTFAVPQSAVREVLEVEYGSLRHVEDREIAPFRGGVLPILRLSRLFHLTEHPRRGLHVFVVGAGQDAVGIAVDRIVGQREIVVRSMADALIRVDGIAGATDLGDGRVVLILDLSVLSRQARGYGQVRTSRVPASSPLQGPVYEDGVR